MHVVVELYQKLSFSPVLACESSVLIAVSAPHRVVAIAACSELIELLKKRVPIFKKEFYDGDKTAQWKQNAEWSRDDLTKA